MPEIPAKEAVKLSMEHVTEFYVFLKKFLNTKPKSLETFVTVCAIESTCKNMRKALWEKMSENLPEDVTRKGKEELKAQLISLAEQISTAPDVKMDAETKAESKLWTPPEKSIV